MLRQAAALGFQADTAQLDMSSSYRRRKRPAENELSELEKLIAETEDQYDVYVPLDKRKAQEDKARRRRLAQSRGEVFEESDDEEAV